MAPSFPDLPVKRWMNGGLVGGVDDVARGGQDDEEKPPFCCGQVQSPSAAPKEEKAAAAPSPHCTTAPTSTDESGMFFIKHHSGEAGSDFTLLSPHLSSSAGFWRGLKPENGSLNESEISKKSDNVLMMFL